MPEPEEQVPPSMGQERGTVDASDLLLSWSGRTDTGRFRKNNEDAFLALTVDALQVRYLGKIGEMGLQDQDLLFAVSDGMGGHNAGEFASRIAVDNITRLLPRTFRQGAEGLPSGFRDVLEELFTRTHADIERYSESYEECRNMGATLSLGWFAPGWMFFAHIGDSRIYYLPAGGGMKQVTEDDSHVGWLRAKGEINEREQRHHPRRNVLSKALGAGHKYIEPQIGAVAYEPGDRFVFCTDGVVDGLWDATIERMLREPRPDLVELPPADRLVKESVEGASRDNTTAVVVEVGPRQASADAAQDPQ